MLEDQPAAEAAEARRTTAKREGKTSKGAKRAAFHAMGADAGQETESGVRAATERQRKL